MHASHFARLPIALAFIAVLVCTGTAPAHTPAVAAPANGAKAPAELEVLELPEVLGAAAADLLDLREFESEAAALGVVQAIDEKLGEREKGHASRAAEARRQTAQAERLRELEELENAWRRERADLEGWRETVTNSALSLQRDIEKVDALRDRWEWARGEARRLEAPAPVSGRIAEMLAAVRTTREAISAQWSDTLRVEGRVGEYLAGVDLVLEGAEEARGAVQEALFARGPIPIWKAIESSEMGQPISEWADENLSRVLESGRDFPERNRGRLLLHALILVLAIALARVLRPQAARWAAEDATLEPTAQLLSRPYAAGVLIAAVATLFVHPNAPRLVMLIAGSLALLAMLRLLPKLLSASARPAFYGLLALYLAERVREVVEGADLAERLLFDFELLVLVAGLIWLSRKRGTLGLTQSPRARTLVQLLLWLWLGLSAISLVGSLAGYVELAGVIGSAAIRSSFGALLFFASYRVLAGLVSISLRMQVLQRLNVVRHQRAVITRRLVSVIRVGLALTWLAFTLEFLTIDDAVYAAGERFFSASFNVGEVGISLGDLGWLTITLVASVYLSRLVRFVLEEDVVSRLDLPRGVPQAISVTAGYIVLFLGFLLALAAAGLDMTRFSILAGAFGVGLGFGLQNVVNNFVSGLILIFERPVQIGDTIELPGLLGDVKRIGIRSSTVRTFQGAEVIVPNGDLISNQVTNWTLSDKRRRIELDVRVRYGTDPTRVIELLLKVAEDDERILRDPVPTALFLEFGVSSLDFQLRAWTADADFWMAIRSDLIVAVNRALAEAGFEVPLPQRDLHLRSVDIAARGALAAPAPEPEGSR